MLGQLAPQVILERLAIQAQQEIQEQTVLQEQVGLVVQLVMLVLLAIAAIPDLVVAVALEVGHPLNSNQVVAVTVPQEALVKGQALGREAMLQPTKTVMLALQEIPVQPDLQERVLLRAVQVIQAHRA